LSKSTVQSFWRYNTCCNRLPGIHVITPAEVADQPATKSRQPIKMQQSLALDRSSHRQEIAATDHAFPVSVVSSQINAIPACRQHQKQQPSYVYWHSALLIASQCKHHNAAPNPWEMTVRSRSLSTQSRFLSMQQRTLSRVAENATINVITARFANGFLANLYVFLKQFKNLYSLSLVAQENN